MNDRDHIGLLKAIRYCKYRWRINRETREISALDSGFLKKMHFQFKFIAYPPLRKTSDASIYFDVFGKKNSKLGIAYQEIYDEFLLKELVYVPDRNYKLKRFLAFILRLPRALFIWVGVIIRAPRVARDHEAMAVLLGRYFYSEFLATFVSVNPVIISDVSPDRYMLASASNFVGRGVIWWQDDYHHIDPPSFNVNIAVVLNGAAKDNISNKYPACRIYARQRKPVKKISTELNLNSPVVGVALNGYFTGSKEELLVLNRISTTLKSELIVRLHPTSKINIDAINLDDSWSFTSSNESLIDFLGRVNVLIVGNTALQLHALREGVCVVHVSGLDTHEFDLYGYVKDGLVYGSACVEEIRVSDVLNFYKNSKFEEKLERILSLDNDVSPLGNLEIDLVNQSTKAR